MASREGSDWVGTERVRARGGGGVNRAARSEEVCWQWALSALRLCRSASSRVVEMHHPCARQSAACGHASGDHTQSPTVSGRRSSAPAATAVSHPGW